MYSNEAVTWTLLLQYAYIHEDGYITCVGMHTLYLTHKSTAADAVQSSSVSG